MIVCTIYCHTHIESGRRYIGQTKRTMERRWSQHVSQSKKRDGGWSYFANAIRKYGPDAFSHEVLEVCHSLEEANEAEEAWINSFSTCDPKFGFNVAKGGSHTPHPIKNPWDRPGYREKLCNAIKQKWEDPEFRASLMSPESVAKRSAKIKESHARPEVKEKISSGSRAGMTPEARQKISDARSGRKLSPETCAKISAASTAAQSSPEYKEMVSSRSKTQWQDPNFRKKHSESNKSSDPSVRAKIAASMLKSRRSGSSKFFGVCYHKTYGKWVASISANGKRHHVGTFPDEESAARAYDIKSRELFGDSAVLNFPN